MSFSGLLSLLATQQKWYHHLQQVVQSLIPHNNYRQYRCTQQTVCSTHTHTYTVTELFTYEVLLYSSLYVFKYCCFHPNSRTMHPNIVPRKQEALAPVINSQQFEKSLLRKVPGNCYSRLPTYLVQVHPPQYSKPGGLYKYLLV